MTFNEQLVSSEVPTRPRSLAATPQRHMVRVKYACAQRLAQLSNSRHTRQIYSQVTFSRTEHTLHVRRTGGVARDSQDWDWEQS